MSTIDLGKIKMVWRGAYNNATAYTIDDAVSLNGTSYICIAATTGNTPPNATYWNVMAQGGTDLGATLSNNQIAIKNNSGNIAGVNIGSANQFLKVNSGATGFEFGDAGGGVLQIKRGTRTSDGSFSSSSAYADWGCSVAITPTANNSSFYINGTAYASPSNHDTPWKFNISDSQVGATTAIFTDASRSHTHMGSTSHFGVGSFGAVSTPDEYWMPQMTVGGMYTPSSNNGNARTFRIICRHSSNGTLKVNQTYTHNSSVSSGGVSTIEVWEIANGIYS